MKISVTISILFAFHACAGPAAAMTQAPAKSERINAPKPDTRAARALFDTLERFKRSAAYASMPARDRADVLAILGAPLSDFRPVMLEASATAAFMNTDPFFEVGGSGETLSSTQEDATITRIDSCTGTRRTGTLRNYTRVAYPNSDKYGVADLRYTTVLGGLINTGGTYSTKEGPRPVDLAIEKIHAVQGQPFPAALGKRFGLLYAQRVDGKDNVKVVEDRLLMCAATDDTRKGGAELTCLRQTAFGAEPAQFDLFRHHFSVSAGCSLDAGDFATYAW